MVLRFSTSQTKLTLRSTFKKCWLSACIMVITAAIYMGSSIWAPAASIGAEEFGVSLTASSLGIALFVLGYAVGPLLLAPISEIPSVGRTPPYIITLFIFTMLQLGTVYVPNFGGFCVLRFLAGFAGSPPLATGGEHLANAKDARRKADVQVQASQTSLGPKCSSTRLELLRSPPLPPRV